jgi:hypothetical protein
MTLAELDQFATPQFLGFVRTVPPPNAFKGTTWLPNRTTFDIAFEYVLGSYSRPVMAHIMGFDAEAPIAGRPGVGAKVSGELPPIKRKKRIGEKEIIRFLQPRAGTNDQQEAINQVYLGVADLLDAVQARVEWLRMQALSEDKVVYNENGVIFSFDYGISDDLQINLVGANPTDGAGTDVSSEFTTAWTDLANSNPVLDLQAIQARSIAASGRRFSQFVAGKSVTDLLLNNAAMKSMIRGSGAPNVLLTTQEINTLFGLYDLPTVVNYDVVVQAEQADGSLVDVRPMANGKAFLVPEGGGVGETLWGPTAESRKLYGTALAGQAPGIWANTWIEDEPPTEWTKAAAVAFPSMPGANALGQMRCF